MRALIYLPLLTATIGHAALIVDLDPSLARFDSLTDADDGVGGFSAGAPTPANGLAFNVTFTPAAGDLDSGSQAVNVMEIGGDANGSGLYLLGGELHFLSKMNGTGTNAANSFNDLNFSSGNNLIGVKSSFGMLSEGIEYTVGVIFDPVDASPSLQIGVLPASGTLALESYVTEGVGAKTNWHGDNSATAFRGGNVGNLGGTIISTSSPMTNPFHEVNINANTFEGVQGQALYWDQSDATLIPEPSSTALFALGSLALLSRRRR
ncbi:PEP-CTERM sorting domain-containing protein [bacterium]|nr:PEP-CTERM sorting domain-containing protein [bacterium]